MIAISAWYSNCASTRELDEALGLCLKHLMCRFGPRFHKQRFMVEFDPPRCIDIAAGHTARILDVAGGAVLGE